MLGMKITNFHYADTTFPKAEGDFTYPKWIHMPGYPDTIARDAEEEADLLSRPPMNAPSPSKPETDVPKPIDKPITTNPTDREMLIQIAKEKGIKLDKRWATDKIKTALEAAG